MSIFNGLNQKTTVVAIFLCALALPFSATAITSLGEVDKATQAEQKRIEAKKRQAAIAETERKQRQAEAQRKAAQAEAERKAAQERARQKAAKAAARKKAKLAEARRQAELAKKRKNAERAAAAKRTKSVAKPSNQLTAAEKRKIDAQLDKLSGVSIEEQTLKRVTVRLSEYAKNVNEMQWSPNMRKNTAMTVKLQTLLDWNHASPGAIDGGWGSNTKKSLARFQHMQNLPSTGRMNAATWRKLISDIDQYVPVIVEYTITQSDVDIDLGNASQSLAANASLHSKNYYSVKEMLAERFHMSIRYLERLNSGKSFEAGTTITVINVGQGLKRDINKLLAITSENTLYAFNDQQLVASYPISINKDFDDYGTYRLTNPLKLPWYNPVTKTGTYIDSNNIRPGPNNPVGVVWIGTTHKTLGLHGTSNPEIVSADTTTASIGLTNWDILEVYANIQHDIPLTVQRQPL